MSSAAQQEANRRNSTLSTGPRTAEGKAASAANALGSGLFATHLYVRPAEAAEYEAMRDELLPTLQPYGVLEDAVALRILNANWRLLRCDKAEAAIPALQNEPNSPFADVHDFTHPAQKAIERARAAAENTLRRATKDLQDLQAERWRRASLIVSGPIHPEDLALAPLKQVLADVPTESQLNRLNIRSQAVRIQNEANYPKSPEPVAFTERTQSGAESPGNAVPIAA